MWRTSWERSDRQTSRRATKGARQMSYPVCMALLVSLCVCCYLLTSSPSSLVATVGPPELHRPGAKFGGMYRRVLHNTPITLDPAFSTDIYGRAVINQIFDGLLQFD